MANEEAIKKLVDTPWYMWDGEEDEEVIFEAAKRLLPDSPVVTKGLIIAREAHKGVYRDKGGPCKVPYFIHCAATTVGIWWFFNDIVKIFSEPMPPEQEQEIREGIYNSLATMSCHDVLEDCDKKYGKIILNELGDVVLCSIAELTKRGEDWYVSLPRNVRKLIENKRLAGVHPVMKSMKLIDRIHNLYTWPKGDSFAYGKDAGLLEETKDMVATMYSNVSEEELHANTPLLLFIEARVSDMSRQ